MFRMSLAEHLGMTLADLGEMPGSELTLWMAYFGRKAREEERATRKAEREAKRARRR